MRYFPCILFFLLIFCSCGKSKESKEECREKLKQQEVQLENLRILSKLPFHGNDTARSRADIGGDEKRERGVKPLCHYYRIPLRFNAC